MKTIENKVIIITGGTSGIGKAFINLLKDGNNTIFNLARSVTEDDYNIKCDVSNLEDVKRAFAIISAKVDHIDLVINNAGYGIAGAIELIAPTDATKVMEVNFNGVLFVCQMAIPLMNKGSRIVNISSACAIFPLPFRTLYCASKSAVSMFSYGLRMELAASGVDVVTIDPGDIRTNFSKNRKITVDTNDRYGKRIQQCVDSIAERESKRMSIEYATKKMYKIFAKKKTKPLYLIGNSTKFLYGLYKIFPLRTLLYFINKMF